MKLNDAQCRSAKGAAEIYKLSDGGGLQLWVHPSGSRTWRLAYRHNGQQRSLTLGNYPDMKLVEARERRDAAKRTLREGFDPAQRTVGEPILFADMIDRWFEAAKGRWTAKHNRRVKSRIDRDVKPKLGTTDIRDLDGPTILTALRLIEKRGALDIAKRARQDISRTFQFAIAEGVVKDDPASNLKNAMMAAPKTQHRASVAISGIPDLVKAIKAHEGTPVVRLAVWFTLHTIVRTKEIRFATWAEIENLEGRQPVWRIPPERMKMNLEHQVPLSKQAVAILREVRQYKVKGHEWIFPGVAKAGNMSENTMLYALYRMGYHSKATIHGFRTIASTVLNESGKFNSDWIERQLSHVETNDVRGAYNAAEWLQPRRKMLQWWSDYLDRRPPGDFSDLV